MKIQWTFRFEYEDLKFERPIKYNVEITKEHAKHFGLPEAAFTAELIIKADEAKPEKVKQTGQILLTLPGNYKDTEEMSYDIVHNLAEHITFSQGRISLASFVSNEMLPETVEEATALGDKRFGYALSFKETSPQVPFDAAAIGKVRGHPLVTQFNRADRAGDPIDQFIGFFKILEDLYGANSKKGLKDSFKNSPELVNSALRLKRGEGERQRCLSEQEVGNLLGQIVEVRHECAHLKSTIGFGLRYGESRVNEIVEPLLPPLRILAHIAIQTQLKNICDTNEQLFSYPIKAQ